MAVSYDSGLCKVRISGMGRHDECTWKQGKVVVFKDPEATFWRLRVDSNFGGVNKLMSSVRLNANVITRVSVIGTRFHLRMTHDNLNIYADKVPDRPLDADYYERLNTLRSILEAIRTMKNPDEILGFTPVKSRNTPSGNTPTRKEGRLDAMEAASIVSGESSAEELFNEPKHTVSIMAKRSPGLLRRVQSPYSRTTRILNNSFEIQRQRENKENALHESFSSVLNSSSSEQASAESFYGGPSGTPTYSRRSSSVLDDISSLDPRIRKTPSRSFVGYSINGPGLLPSPTPGKLTTTPSKVSTSSPFSPTTPTLQGFSNIGNTCYLNAILQALLSQAPFQWDLISNLHKYRSLPDPGLYLPLVKLCQLKRKGEKDKDRIRYCLKEVKNAISSSAKRFCGYEQHDAHEFLAQLLDQLNEEVREVEKKEELHLINPTVKNFEIEILHTIKCLGCGAEVTKTELIYDMSVEMPESESESDRKTKKAGTIQQALETFFKPERLEYKCEDCGHGESRVSHLITKLPRILVIHLKRYSYDSTFQMHSKVGKPIHINRFVCMAKFCDEETTRARTPENPELLKEIGRAGSSSEEGDAIVPQAHKSSPLRTETHGEGLDRTDGPVILDLSQGAKAEKSEDVDNDLEIALKMSQQQFEVDTLDEDEQLRLALERSIHDTQAEPKLVISASDKLGNLPSPNMFDESDPYESSLDSDAEKAVLPKSVDSNHNIISEEFPCLLSKSTPNKGNFFNNYSSQSPLATKRRRHVAGTPSKSRKLEEGKQVTVVVESSDSDATIVNRTVEMSDENDDNFESFLSHSAKPTVGLKGGAQFEDDEEKENVAKERCRMCNAEKVNCSCDSDDAVILSMDSTAVDRPLLERLQTRCSCSVIKAKPSGWCQFCRSKSKAPVDNDSKPAVNKWSRFLSQEESPEKSAISVGTDKREETPPKPRTYEKKYEPADPDWVKNREKKEESSCMEDLDAYLAEIRRAKEESLKDAEKESELSLQETTFQGLSEEEILRKVMEESLKDQKVESVDEDEQMELALKASLQETVPSIPEPEHEPKSTPVKPQKPRFNFSSTDEETDIFIEKQTPKTPDMMLENGKLSNVYELVGVVNHLGSTASFGHYVADVFDAGRKEWLSYDDSTVTTTHLKQVRETRSTTGYVFFFMAKDVLNDVRSQIDHPLLKKKAQTPKPKLQERNMNAPTRKPGEKKTYTFVKNKFS